MKNLIIVASVLCTLLMFAYSKDLKSTLLVGKARRRTVIRHQSFNIQPVHQFLVFFTTDPPHDIKLVFCTGVLYTNKLAISAANCIYDFIAIGYNQVLVELANTHLTENSVCAYRNIIRTAVYQGYNANNPGRGTDLALIELNSPFTEYCNLVTPATDYNYVPTAAVTVLGWKFLNSEINFSYQELQQFRSRTSYYDRDYYQQQASTKIFASTYNENESFRNLEGNEDIQFGDNGGPVLDENMYLVGVTSYIGNNYTQVNEDIIIELQNQLA